MNPLDLTPLRKAAELLLPDSATIQRYTTVSDGGGGYSQTWLPTVTVKCRLAPRQAKPQESGAQGGIQNVTEWLITVPVGTDVTEEDRLVVNGRTFEVAKSLLRSFQTAQQVVAVEVV